MTENETPTSTRALFTPLTLRGVELPNRIGVSPMCMYASADGFATDFHIAHLGRFAMGGAGLVTAEATAVSPEGRIGASDLGIWKDEHVPNLARVAALIKDQGAVPGIQLSHAGRRAAVREPWHAGAPLDDSDAAAGTPPWEIIGPSAISVGPGHQTPRELSEEEVLALIQNWADGARRAVEAGFEFIELHGAHGYLLHSFLSPLANHRQDAWGGDSARRMRFPLEVIKAVRDVIGERALSLRVSAVDGYPNGLDLDDVAEFSRHARAAGVDLIDVSSGGISTDRSTDTRVRRVYGFHADFSRELRSVAGGPVATVGLIVDAEQAAQIVEREDADLVLLGREMLDNPSWALHAQVQLGADLPIRGDIRINWPLSPRRSLFAKLKAEGETPLSRFYP